MNFLRRLFNKHYDANEEHHIDMQNVLYMSVNQATMTVFLFTKPMEQTMLDAYETHLKKQGYFAFIVVAEEEQAIPTQTEIAFNRLVQENLQQQDNVLPVR